VYAGKGRTMKTSMLVRLKPYDPKKGLLLKQYSYRGIRFQAGRGWYKVNGQVAAYLEGVHSVPGDNDTPLAFDVCTPDEARAMDEKDRKAARQVLPAEEALDVSHVRDAQLRAKSRPSPDRDDAPRRQRRDLDRMPENAQTVSLDDEDMEDETPRRRFSRCRIGAVSRRPGAVVADLGAFDEDDAFDDEAPRSRARRGRAEAVPRRRLRADGEELDEEGLDDKVDEFDADELGDEFNKFDDDEREDAPSLARRSSLPPRSQASQSRRIQRYTIEQDAFDDRQTHRVRGTRQAEARDALWHREARRTRRQPILADQAEQMARTRSQAWHQDELHIRHAQQMAAELEETEALDDAMSYGDAEDSLPTRSRHNSHGDAEDSLPTRSRHNGHGDAEDSLPTRSRHNSHGDAEDSLPTRSRHNGHGDAEDSLPGKGARNRHSGHGDAEDSLPTRSRHNSHGDAEDSLPTRSRHNGHGDAEDSLPRCDRRMQHEVAPSARHAADAQDDLGAVDHEFHGRTAEELVGLDARGRCAQQPPSSTAHDKREVLDDALDDSLEQASEDQRPGSAQPRHAQRHTGSSPQRHADGGHDAASSRDDLGTVDHELDDGNVEESAQPDARGQCAQQPPSSAAHDELNALDDALDDSLEKASEDQRPGSAQPHARGQRAQQPPSSAAHDEHNALDDALDDSLEKASEDQRPGSAQPRYGQQRMGCSPQRHPEGGHDATGRQDDLGAADHEFGDRNVEKPAQPNARGQRAQQPPSSTAHDKRDVLDDALDDSLEQASEDQRPGSAQPQHAQQHTGSRPQRQPDAGHDAASSRDDLGAVEYDFDGRNIEEPVGLDARGQRAQQPPSSAAHGELDALDDALDDSLEKASEDQRPGSAQPQHAQRHTGSSPQRQPDAGHDAASGEHARHECQPGADKVPFVNRDARHQAPAVRHVPVAAASASPRPRRRTDPSVQNSHARNRPDILAHPAIRSSAEELAQPRQRAPPDDRRPPQPLSQPERTKHLLPSENVPEEQCRQVPPGRPRKTE
jgi:hypothetical protein